MANSMDDLGKIGVKFDKFKNRLDLLPTDALREIALAFTYGAHKYEDRNWERGVNHSQLYRAALNHLDGLARARRVRRRDQPASPRTCRGVHPHAAVHPFTRSRKR